MKYERPKYGDPCVETETVNGMFLPPNLKLPKFDRPITAKENFYRAARHDHPVWVPIVAADMQEMHMSQLYDNGPEGLQLGPKFGDPRDRYTYKDAFGNSWTYDRNAGGSCLTIGTRICDDILKWEEQIKFPDLHEWDIEERAARFMKEEHDPNKVLHLDIYHGPFQALSDMLGGFAEALEAMFVEPEASRAFFDRYVDWLIWLVDKLSAIYPVDMFTVHDDWGTEKDAFFSPKMMEELLYEPTKRLIDHVHGLGKLYQFHCCGKIDRFMPYFAELKPDFTQLQRRVNDLPEYKRTYGANVGFQAGIEGLEFGRKYTDDELAQLVRDTLDIYCSDGGFFPAIYGSPEMMWKMVSEAFCYSRELYEKL